MTPMKVDMPVNTAIAVKIHHRVLSILVGFNFSNVC